MAEGNGIRYALKWIGLEIIWLASANVAIRVAPRSTSLAHVHSLCVNRRSVTRIQISSGDDESVAHLMHLQALDA